MLIGEGAECLAGYIGGCNLVKDQWRQLEQQINILKACMLVKEIGDKEITRELVLAALERLNVQAEINLARLPGVVTLNAKDPTDKFGTKIYCEDHRLSSQRPGLPYRALVLPPDGTPTIGYEEVRQVVDWASAFVDLHSFYGTGDATRKALCDLRDRRRAAEPVVRALLSRMCRARAMWLGV